MTVAKRRKTLETSVELWGTESYTCGLRLLARLIARCHMAETELRRPANDITTLEEQRNQIEEKGEH